MLDSIVPFLSTCPVFSLSPSLFWLLRKNMGAAWFLIIMSVGKFSILMSFILQRQKTVQKRFLRKAGVSWKPTGENPAGLIHVHCISKENHLPKFRFRFIILIYKSTQNLFLVSVRKHKACFWIQRSILFSFSWRNNWTFNSWAKQLCTCITILDHWLLCLKKKNTNLKLFINIVNNLEFQILKQISVYNLERVAVKAF